MHWGDPASPTLPAAAATRDISARSTPTQRLLGPGQAGAASAAVDVSVGLPVASAARQAHTEELQADLDELQVWQGHCTAGACIGAGAAMLGLHPGRGHFSGPEWSTVQAGT